MFPRIPSKHERTPRPLAGPTAKPCTLRTSSPPAAGLDQCRLPVMARGTGLEPVTDGLENRCSIRLSYPRVATAAEHEARPGRGKPEARRAEGRGRTTDGGEQMAESGGTEGRSVTEGTEAEESTEVKSKGLQKTDPRPAPVNSSFSVTPVSASEEQFTEATKGPKAGRSRRGDLYQSGFRAQPTGEPVSEPVRGPTYSPSVSFVTFCKIRLRNLGPRARYRLLCGLNGCAIQRRQLQVRNPGAGSGHWGSTSVWTGRCGRREGRPSSRPKPMQASGYRTPQ